MNCSKIEDEDYYKILKILPNSTEAEIRKAYRKKALQVHPDKNPNNPHAVKQFQKLLKILETLTDKSKRKEYDRQLEIKKAASRHSKMMEDLEAQRKKKQSTRQGKTFHQSWQQNTTTHSFKQKMNKNINPNRKKKFSANKDKTTRQSRQNLEGLANIAEISWYHTMVSISVMTIVIINIFCDHKIKL